MRTVALRMVASLAALLSACGGNVMDLGRDVADSGAPGQRYATREELAREPEAGSNLPTLIAAGQSGTKQFIVDDTRIYWTTWMSDNSNVQLGTGVFRSCAKDDCAGTLVTYATNNRAIEPIATNGTRVFFGLPEDGPHTDWRLRSCPVEGCESGAFEIGGQHAMAITADESHVYWLSDGAIQRCAADGCGGIAPEVIAANVHLTQQGGTDALLGDAKGIVFSRSRDDIPGSQIVDLQKSDPYWMGVVANSAAVVQSIGADEERVYWTESLDPRVKSCPRTGCGSTPAEYLADQAGAAALVAAKKGRAHWFWGATAWLNRPEPLSTTLFECPSTGCGSTPRALAHNQRYPCAIAVDDTHVYWRTCLDLTQSGYLNGDILRIRK